MPNDLEFALRDHVLGELRREPAADEAEIQTALARVGSPLRVVTARYRQELKTLREFIAQLGIERDAQRHRMRELNRAGLRGTQGIVGLPPERVPHRPA